MVLPGKPVCMVLPGKSVCMVHLVDIKARIVATYWRSATCNMSYRARNKTDFAFAVYDTTNSGKAIAPTVLNFSCA